MKTKLFFTSFLMGLAISGYSQWTSQADVPYNAGQISAVAHPNGKIYLIAGYTGALQMDSVGIFNQAGNTWSRGTPIPYPTRGAAYALGQDSLIYIFGGYNGGDIDSSFKYNTKTDKWISIAHLPTGVWYAAAATAPNGKIYVFGGENGTSLVQIYNPTLNTWSAGTPLPTPVLEAGAVTGPDGKIYVIGGLTGGPIDSVQIYDPVGNSWTRGKPMPTDRNEFGYVKDDANGDIYCIGGKTNGGNNSSPFLNVVEIYNVYGNSWTTGQALPHGLGETVAASINNGINVFGGTDSAIGYCAHNYRLDIVPSAINHALGAGEGFNVYPNPSNGNVNIWVASLNSENMTIRIMDITGQVIFTHTWSDFSGEEVKNIDMSGYSKGMYFVQYISDKSNVVKKLIIQ